MPPNALLVYGASGHGREIMSWADAAGTFDVLGFVDDDPATHGTSRVGHQVLGGFEWLAAAERELAEAAGLPAPFELTDEHRAKLQRVAVEETRLEGASASIVVPAAHTFIMNRRDVRRAGRRHGGPPVEVPDVGAAVATTREAGVRKRPGDGGVVQGHVDFL